MNRRFTETAQLAGPLFAFTLSLLVSAEARAESTLLSCSGTVRLLQGGKQVNEKGERYSVSVKIDVGNGSLTIDGETWPLVGDTSSDVIVSISENRGSATLNRITGAASIHRIQDGLQIFEGICKPAQKLF